MDKARRSLLEARAVVEIELAEAAGRTAYLTAFHAAQTLIFDRTGKVAKTHSGVRSEFARISKDDLRIDRGLSEFLAQAYNLKSVTYYSIDPSVGVTLAEAGEAIFQASLFVERVAQLLREPLDANER